MDVPGLAGERLGFKCSNPVNDRLQRTSPVKVTAYALHPMKSQRYFITSGETWSYRHSWPVEGF